MASQNIKPVIVDAMGGDHAPDEVVLGAIEAAREYGIEIVLVGRPDELSKHDLGSLPIRIEPAAEVIGMDEHPARALRRKPNSSIRVAAALLKRTPGASVVSAGSTGAVLAAALLDVGRMEGIERPALAAVIPTSAASAVVLDVGANVDCKPSNLIQFAQMGAAYARCVLGVDNPRIGILNIGAEEAKGNELCLSAFPLLRDSVSGFVGNVEPAAIFSGDADVVVTDGFAGNIFLKTGEAVSHTVNRQLQNALGTLDANLRQSLSSKLERFMPSRPEHSGAPLLGVEGAMIVAHGASKARTMKHAIHLAHRFASSDAVDSIRCAGHGRKDHDVQTAV